MSLIIDKPSLNYGVPQLICVWGTTDVYFGRLTTTGFLANAPGGQTYFVRLEMEPWFSYLQVYMSVGVTYLRGKIFPLMRSLPQKAESVAETCHPCGLSKACWPLEKYDEQALV